MRLFACLFSVLALAALRAGARRGRSAPRHGGGAGGARRPHRRRRSWSAAAMRSMPRSRPASRMAVTYPRAGNIGGGGYMVIHLADVAAKAAQHRHRLPRDRAGGGDARHVPRREGQRRPAQVARFRARDRRARHGRGACAGAPALRLRAADAGRADRAGDRARARRLRDRGRRRGFAAARADAARRAGRRRPRSSCKPDGNALAPGDTLVQRDLADTLEAIAQARARAPSTKARSPRSSPPPCRPPAAS